MKERQKDIVVVLVTLIAGIFIGFLLFATPGCSAPGRDKAAAIINEHAATIQARVEAGESQDIVLAEEGEKAKAALAALAAEEAGRAGEVGVEGKTVGLAIAGSYVIRNLLNLGLGAFRGGGWAGALIGLLTGLPALGATSSVPKKAGK